MENSGTAERVNARNLADLPGLSHGFFTRRGGVSQGLYSSLNCGLGSQDDPANVQENRARVARELGAPPAALITAFQHHSTDVISVTSPWTDQAAPKGDAMVTRRPYLALGVLTADCAPLLLADMEAHVIGAAHAGWRGALGGILENTVVAMETLGARRERIRLAIGPTLSAQAYEVGPEFRSKFLTKDPSNDRYFHFPETNGRPHFDLPAFLRDQAHRLGVGDIETLDHCTYSSESRYFSYRRSVHRGESDYGRQISAIMML